VLQCSARMDRLLSLVFRESFSLCGVTLPPEQCLAKRRSKRVPARVSWLLSFVVQLFSAKREVA